MAAKADAMRSLTLADRNAAIEASPNVIDARQELARRMQQRLAAKRYRSTFRGGPKTRA